MDGAHPEPDFTVTDHGTVRTITAVSEAAQEHYRDHIAPELEGWQTVGTNAFHTDWRAAEHMQWRLEDEGWVFG